MTNAISAVRRQVREMVDGTLELRLHIEPKDKAAFHQLFPEIDMPVAIAPLKPQFEQAKPESEKDKPGPLCVLSAKWCKQKEFQLWMIKKYGALDATARDIGTTFCELRVANSLRDLCEIQSRRELDANEQAANRFQTLIRLPYMKYQQTGDVE